MNKDGYGLQLTKFDSQYEDCVITRSSKREIIELADKIIRSFGKPNLMEQLNEMQAEAMYCDTNKNEAFKNKYEIPAYFINLLLKDYNMKVVGW
nr:MAG TPA: hypothetical protein [Caudoviricetes sp.]